MEKGGRKGLEIMQNLNTHPLSESHPALAEIDESPSPHPPPLIAILPTLNNVHEFPKGQ
jgi:hypothetical protein